MYLRIIKRDDGFASLISIMYMMVISAMCFGLMSRLRSDMKETLMVSQSARLNAAIESSISIIGARMSAASSSAECADRHTFSNTSIDGVELDYSSTNLATLLPINLLDEQQLQRLMDFGGATPVESVNIADLIISKRNYISKVTNDFSSSATIDSGKIRTEDELYAMTNGDSDLFNRIIPIIDFMDVSFDEKYAGDEEKAIYNGENLFKANDKLLTTNKSVASSIDRTLCLGSFMISTTGNIPGVTLSRHFIVDFTGSPLRPFIIISSASNKNG